MILERDEKMLEWLSQFKMATPTQINHLFYNNSDACYRRLRRLHEDKIIKRFKNTVGLGWVYCTEAARSTKQLQHCLTRNDFYIKLLEVSEVKDVLIGRKYANVIPDGYFKVVYKGRLYRFLLEVETERNAHAINIDKYNNYFLSDWKKDFAAKPTIIYVTNKKIPKKCSFNYKILDPKLENFNDIWE